MCVRHPHYKICSFFEAVATINMWTYAQMLTLDTSATLHLTFCTISWIPSTTKTHTQIHMSVCVCLCVCMYPSAHCSFVYKAMLCGSAPSSRTFSCLHMWVCVYNESGRVRRDSGLHLQVWWSLCWRTPSINSLSGAERVFTCLCVGFWCLILEADPLQYFGSLPVFVYSGTNGQARCESCSDGRRIQMHTHVYTHPHPICLTHQIFSQSARSSIFTVGKIG